MKKIYDSILLSLLLIFMGGSYFIFRLISLNNITTIILTLALILLPSLIIYWVILRPKSMPKLLVYITFILSIGASYFIIPPPQKDFFNQMLIWLLPVLEISIILIVVYSIIKSVIRYRANNKNPNNDFLQVIRQSLEPKLGNSFLLEAVLAELSIIYYSIIAWFKKSNIIQNGKVYSYHKNSQIKPIVILFSILLILEGILLHVLLQLWSDIAAWIFTILNIYAFLYIIGLYNSVRLLPHEIYLDKLIIRLGFQSSIELDMRNIESIEKAKQGGGILDKIPSDTYYSLVSMDTPQYEILLKKPVLMKSSYGRKKPVKSVVFRADEPNKMIEEINSYIK